MHNEATQQSNVAIAAGQDKSFSAAVGMVVIGRNEAVRLENTLRAAMVVGLPLIYVDSRSKDHSVALARSLGVEVLVLSDDKPVNASRARNEGARFLLARHPNLRYLQFLDGDTAVQANWPQTAFRHLEAHGELGFVCGQLWEKDRNQNAYRRLCDMEWRWEASDNAEPCRLGGMGMIRLDAFLPSGGYDERLIAGADPELYGRLAAAGWVLHVLAEPMGEHDSGMQEFRQWWIRSVKSGFSFAQGRASGAWGKERRSALIWGGLLPLSIVAAIMPLGGWALAILLVYPLNVLRIWLGPAKREFSPDDRWLYAAACMGMKVPQCIGLAKQFWRSRSGQAATVIQYK